MLNWITSSDFLLSVVILATAAMLFVWEKRRLKRTAEEQWKTLAGARRIWTLTEGKKSVEAAWITAMRESIARDPWQPGLKPSATEAQITKLDSHLKIAKQTESMRCPTKDAARVSEAHASRNCSSPRRSLGLGSDTSTGLLGHRGIAEPHVGHPVLGHKAGVGHAVHPR